MITDRLRHELHELLSLKRKPIIEGWTTQEKAEALGSVIIDHKLRNLVEVGVFGGRSLFAMAMALRENGMGTIWGIDPWTLEAALEGENGEEHKKWWTENLKLEDIYIGFIKAVLDLNLTPYCRWIRERGDVAHRLFKDGSVDLVHLDANHSELCSVRDVQLWAPKVRPGGFLVMDDTDWTSQSKALKLVSNYGFKDVVKTTTFTIFQKPQK